MKRTLQSASFINFLSGKMWPSKLSFPWIFTPHNSSALILIFSILFTRKWRRLTEIYSNITLAVFYRVFNFIFLYNTPFLWKKNLATFILLCLSWNISVKFLSPSTWRTKSVCLHYVSHPCFLFFIINFLVFIFPLLIILHTCSNWRENNTEGFHCIRTTSNCEITL